MGVVRREGDWRLEKRGEGVYEITFKRESQIRVLTSDAPPQERGQPLLDAVPVREVSSYSEAEGLFEEKAHGPPPLGMEYSSRSSTGGGTEDLELSEVPPGGIGLALLIAGGFVVYTFSHGGNTLVLLLGLGFAGIGLAVFAYAAYLFRAEGWRAAWDFLATVDEGGTSRESSSNETEKTPPVPEKLKNELIFDRARQQCEWCEQRFDHPHVHHIEPRREGGPNEPENLIVLCPNCHEKADREAIPRSKLRAKVKRLPEISSG